LVITGRGHLWRRMSRVFSA